MPVNSSSSMARRRVAGPPARASGLRSRPRRPSAFWAATIMFSMTVSRENTRVSWKVRPMPAENTLFGAALVICLSPR